MERFPNEVTAYDVFLGIFVNFPERKNTFRGYYEDVVDFLKEQRKQYFILSEFTQDNLSDGLNTLIGGGMLRYNTADPKSKEFDETVIECAFERYNKRLLFGEEGLTELKDLSKKFVERFS